MIVALNWSNMEFPETGPDGPPPNPEWVSMDVWVEYMNSEPVNRIEIFGDITHACISEPSTLPLLGL